MGIVSHSPTPSPQPRFLLAADDMCVRAPSPPNSVEERRVGASSVSNHHSVVLSSRVVEQLIAMSVRFVDLSVSEPDASSPLSLPLSWGRRGRSSLLCLVDVSVARIASQGRRYLGGGRLDRAAGRARGRRRWRRSRRAVPPGRRARRIRAARRDPRARRQGTGN